MGIITYFVVVCAMFGRIKADAVIDIGFQFTQSQSSHHWRDGLEINATCTATCNSGCTDCNNLIYEVQSRNMTYYPDKEYRNFQFHPIENLTEPFQRRCTIKQVITLANVSKNDSGAIYCKSLTNRHKLGIIYINIFYNANYTNATLPTELIVDSVDVESSDLKLEVRRRRFDTSDTNNFPHINCTLTGGTGSSDFAWTRANGTNLVPEDGISQSRYPATGTLDENAVVSILTFAQFATKAAANVGKYKCSYSGSSMTPSVFSAPVAKMGDKDYRSVMEGDVLTQICSIVAYPQANITWSRNNKTLLADDRIKFSSDNLTMTIHELKKTDAGLYICSAHNSLGVGEAYIKLRVKDRYAALWPFLGIVAEVAILVTIILLYEKKRAAQKRSQEDQDTAEVKDDRNANESDVRHRQVRQ